jgi:hypothetical protein
MTLKDQIEELEDEDLRGVIAQRNLIRKMIDIIKEFESEDIKYLQEISDRVYNSTCDPSDDILLEVLDRMININKKLNKECDLNE